MTKEFWLELTLVDGSVIGLNSTITIVSLDTGVMVSRIVNTYGDKEIHFYPWSFVASLRRKELKQ